MSNHGSFLPTESRCATALPHAAHFFAAPLTEPSTAVFLYVKRASFSLSRFFRRPETARMLNPSVFSDLSKKGTQPCYPQPTLAHRNHNSLVLTHLVVLFVSNNSQTLYTRKNDAPMRLHFDTTNTPQFRSIRTCACSVASLLRAVTRYLLRPHLDALSSDERFSWLEPHLPSPPCVTGLFARVTKTDHNKLFLSQAQRKSQLVTENAPLAFEQSTDSGSQHAPAVPHEDDLELHLASIALTTQERLPA